MGAGLQLQIVTPESVTFDESIDHVVLPSWKGELAVYPRHAPLLSRMGFGELRAAVGGQMQRFFVDGGIVEVRGERVTVLSDRAIPAAKLRGDRLDEEEAALRGRSTTDQDELESIRVGLQKVAVQRKIASN